MRALVTGGTGTLGLHLAAQAAEHGWRVRIMSRRPRPESAGAELEWATADLASGDGLDEAVAGVHVILHAATSPDARAARVDVEGTKRLVDAARAAGVRHLLYPSIVGIDRVPFPYYRHKLEAERVLDRGGMPHTILRATQFHEFLDQILSAVARVPVLMPLPTEMPFQSVAACEVAARLVRSLEDGPEGRLPDFGGPEIVPLGEMAVQWLESTDEHRRVVRLPIPGKTARAFRRGEHTTPERREGRVRWREWLRERGTGAPHPG